MKLIVRISRTFGLLSMFAITWMFTAFLIICVFSLFNGYWIYTDMGDASIPLGVFSFLINTLMWCYACMED